MEERGKRAGRGKWFSFQLSWLWRLKCQRTVRQKGVAAITQAWNRAGIHCLQSQLQWAL